MGKNKERLKLEFEPPKAISKGGKCYVRTIGHMIKGESSYLFPTGSIERYTGSDKVYHKNKEAALKAINDYLKPTISLDVFKEPEDG